MSDFPEKCHASTTEIIALSREAFFPSLENSFPLYGVSAADLAPVQAGRAAVCLEVLTQSRHCGLAAEEPFTLEGHETAWAPSAPRIL